MMPKSLGNDKPERESRSRRLLLICLCCCLANAACLVNPTSLPPNWNIRTSEPNGLELLSYRIMLIADNQLHNVYSKPVPIYRTAQTDRLVPSAIRSALLDFYGQDILRWAVTNSKYRIVHLGDACDFSCTGEFTAFCEIMSHAPKAWVMAPGNHDGYFFGNENRAPSNGTWTDACNNSGQPMTKDRFIRLYLMALAGQDQTELLGLESKASAGREPENTFRTYLYGESSALAMNGADNPMSFPSDVPSGLMPDEGNWENETSRFLRSVRWKINRREPWKSYVIQRLELTHSDQLNAATSRLKAGAILLDTCQYGLAPALVAVPPGRVAAGLNGEILEDQLRDARQWIAEESNAYDYTWILLGHHPFATLRSHARQGIDAIRKTARTPLFVSAHTHDGDFLVHGANDRALLELNIGSILDWPLEMRHLSLGLTTTHRTYVRCPRLSAYDRLANDLGNPDGTDDWQVSQEDPDYYLRHSHLDSMSAVETELNLKAALLATHKRMLRTIPTDRYKNLLQHEKWFGDGVKSDADVIALIDAALSVKSLDCWVDLLLRLKEFEDARLSIAYEHDWNDYIYFRLTQAIWASRYDAARARKPWRDDWFIELPRD